MGKLAITLPALFRETKTGGVERLAAIVPLKTLGGVPVITIVPPFLGMMNQAVG
jgi:hypothetical protein